MSTIATAQPAALGPPSAFKIVVSTKPEKGELTYIETITKLVPVQKEIAVMQNGQIVKKVVTEYVREIVQEYRLIDIAKSRVITPDGKQLPIDEVWKRLKANTAFALAADSNTPAQAYMRALNAETLVIIQGPPKKN
ncbi:MAG: hypothetical protein EXR98_00835 [Gemmataceae bacterium]|nr:hypothetical protein [Gemmataceae bacterium]